MNEHQAQEYYYQLGINIQEARKTAGLSQEILGNKVGLSRPSIVNIEKGRHKIAIHQLIEITEALGIELGTVLPARTSFKDGDKIVSATLPKIITDKETVDAKTEQFVASFLLFMNNK
jgi:transcriptional regulator with XRE-family HTH domain